MLKMKVLAFSVWLLLLFAENNAKLPNPNVLISKLIDAVPDTIKLFNLCQPINLTTDEIYEIESIGTEKLQFNFSQVTVPKPVPKDRAIKNYHTELTCEFHNKLWISQAIEPGELEIRGKYETIPFQNTEKLKDFSIKQYSGYILHTVFVNGTNQTELFYENEEANVGKNSGNDILIVSAMGEVIRQVKNQTLRKTDKSGFKNKIEDFQNIFPIMSSCLSPADSAESNLLSKYAYKITNHRDSRQWRSFSISIPEIVINGTTNFKWSKISATGSGKSSIQLNVIAITNPLKGRFKWHYQRNYQLWPQNISYFFINNLTLKSNLSYTDCWVVNNVTADIGAINVHKIDATTEDINEFMNDILSDYLKSIIIDHYEQLVLQTYSKEGASKVLNDMALEQLLDFEHYYKNALTPPPQTTNTTRVPFFTRWNNPFSFSKRWNDSFRANLSTLATLTTTAGYSNSSLKTNCVDTRRWWQKLFKRNQCKTNQTLLAPVSTPAHCEDTRRWWQKPFKRNMCKPS